MSDLTTNLQLKKPLDNETADIAVINENMDKIDTAIAAKETPVGAQTKVNALAGAGNTKTVKEVADEVTAHKAETMPHKFTDGTTTYRYGLSVINGVVTMTYEVVV